MSALVLVALAVVGLISGFVAGLIGIGGGVLIVPFLYFFYSQPEWTGFVFPESLHVTVAHATSLLVIVPTAARGAWSYSKANLIAWRVAVPIAIASIAGGVLGARLAVIAPGELLKTLFGLLLIASAVHLVKGKQREPGGILQTGLLRTTLVGLAIGLLSGMMGVGGGILALPLLMHVLHVDLRRSAATSLAIVGVAATASVATYAISGLGVDSLPSGSIGYVHVYAALPILVGSLAAVHWGTLANQKLNARVLKWIFAVFFLGMGLKFVIENVGELLR